MALIPSVAPVSDAHISSVSQERVQRIDIGLRGVSPDDDVDVTTTALQAIYDEAAGLGAEVWWPVADTAYNVKTIDVSSHTATTGRFANLREGLGGTLIQGTSGYDIFNLVNDGDGNRRGFTFSNIRTTGGRRGLAALASTTAITDVRVQQCEFSSPSDECVYFEGAPEELYFDQVLLSGGIDGFRHADVGIGGGQSLLDKSTFKDVRTQGQSRNGWRIEADVCNSVTLINPIGNNAGQHWMYLNGGLRSFVLINPNTEGNGSSGKHQRTTGTISSSSTSLVVASATGYTTGDPITICGAGPNGGSDLTTVIDNIVGTTITLHDAASTSVTSAKVTNASFDDIYIDNSIAQTAELHILGGYIGGEGTLGRLRYAVNAGVSGPIIATCDIADPNIPIYDPQMQVMFTGSGSHRVPSGLSNLFPAGVSVPHNSDNSYESNRAWMTSPPGKPLTFFLKSHDGTTGGTFDRIEFRALDPNREMIAFIDGSTRELAVYDGTLRIYNALRHSGSTLGFFNTSPTTKPTVTGSRGSNAALTSLLTQLAALGLITDSSS